MSRPQNTKGTFSPAPVRGVDTRASAYSEGSDLAVLLRDMIPKNLGVEVRPGYKDWATNVGLTDEGSAQEVRTVAPFHDSDSTTSKFWAFTKGGIYDITSSADDPAQTQALPIGTSEGGYFSWINFTNTAGTHYLACVDGLNGYWRYSVASGWIEITAGAGANQINGADPRTFSYVTTWKNRIWFVQKDTTFGWYLTGNGIDGTVAKFNFGSKFRYGGKLVGLYNFTMDGGLGMDDFLVAVSSAGDIAIYKGTDPASSTTFSLVGSWYLGPTPKGNRIASEFGGDLFILTEYGITPLSRILQGAATVEGKTKITEPIINEMNVDIIRSRGDRSWELKIDTNHNILVVVAPENASADTDFKQYCMDLTGQVWCTFTTVPMLTADMYNGDFYFGTSDGRVCIMDGTLDAVERDGTGGSPVDWALITHSSDYGLPGQFKRVQMMRPVFIGSERPSYELVPRYDADFSEPSTPSNPANETSSLWDVAVWDVDAWVGTPVSYSPAVGALGIGINVAYGLHGRSRVATTFIGVNIMFDAGGYL